MFRPFAAIAVFSVLLSACAGGAPKVPRERIDRALAGAPGLAQPSRVVATELAFAREAKTRGLAQAWLDFASPDAAFPGRNGPVSARLGQPADDGSNGATDRSPRLVVMSCDGSMAVSQGRFRQPDGVVGNYVTVWQRVNDTEYRWAYGAAGPDVPQPPPRNFTGQQDDIITVEAFDSVQGLVGSCARGGQAPAPPPQIRSTGEQPSGGATSRDGTLRWRWQHRAGGIKYVAADYYTAGGWETAIEEALPSPNEDD